MSWNAEGLIRRSIKVVSEDEGAASPDKENVEKNMIKKTSPLHALKSS